MSSPGGEQPGQEGMSHLQAFWLYQLQQGNQLRVCFPCFKVVFQTFQESLEAGDWDPERVQHPWAGPEEEPQGQQGADQPELGGLEGGGSDTLASDSDESEEPGLMPTEPTPQNGAAQGLGPEGAAGTQGPPQRSEGAPTCSPCTSSPYVVPRKFLHDILPQGQPMLLQLETTQEVDVAEAQARLLSLPAMAVVGTAHGTYLRHMAAQWVRPTPEGGWAVLLEPDDQCVLQLQSEAPGPELSSWGLSLLESAPTGYGTHLVPAGAALLLRGFRVLSYSPWNKVESEEDNLASEPEASPPGQGPDLTGTGSWGAWENLGSGGAPPVPAPQAEAQVSPGQPQAPSDWEGQAAAPLPQPEELLAGAGCWGQWWGNEVWPRDGPGEPGEPEEG